MRDEVYCANRVRLVGAPIRNAILVFLVLYGSSFWCGQACWAVSSRITRHSSSADFLKGEVQDAVIGSQGTIQLGRSAEALVAEFEDVWSINSIVVSGGTVYLGTSPNGGIYKYSLGELTKIYPKNVIPVETGNQNNQIGRAHV